MPNAPAENTVSTSFTLPRELMEAIELKAKRELTNKSELIRRALLNYLSEEERAHVLREIHGEVPPSGAKPASGGGSYFKSRRRKQRS